MTTHQAKQDARTKLEAAGIPFQHIRAKTVSFEGFGYDRAVFVYVAGIDFQTPLTLAKWDALRSEIPRPSNGGYILKSGV